MILYVIFVLFIDCQYLANVISIGDVVEIVASVGFSEVSQRLAEDAGPTLACIQFTTTSGFPLEEDVAVYIQSSDYSAVSSPIDPGSFIVSKQKSSEGFENV